MAIRDLIIDNEPLEDTSWATAEQAIESLNGVERCVVFIGDMSTENYMAVSGGNNGRYLVLVQEGKNGDYTLINEEHGDELVMIRVGGCEEYYPASRAQDLGTVLAVAKPYYQSGRKDRGRRWGKGQ